MGKAPDVLTPFTGQNVARFQQLATNGLAYLGQLTAGLLPNNPMMGFEKEVGFTGRKGQMAPIAQEILDDLKRDHVLWKARGFDDVVQELLRSQLEINAQPCPLRGQPFTATRDRLNKTCQSLHRRAMRFGGELVPTGILLGYKPDDFVAGNVYPNPRYEQLCEAVRQTYGEFVLEIQGDRERIAHPWRTIAVEGATTSIQPHLTLQPHEVVDGYNAARIAVMLLVAVGSGSPMLFGQKLWHETRIAVMEGCVGRTRPGTDDRPRTGLGAGWISNPLDPFRESLVQPPLVIDLPKREPTNEDALSALLLLHSTNWPWVRLIYGTEPWPHFRLEFRPSPSGTTYDDMANAAFAFGLTRLLMKSVGTWIADGLDFETIREGFTNAAKEGIDALVPWPTEGGKTLDRDIPALVLELLPQIEDELVALGVDQTEAREYLGIIRGRMMDRLTPSAWILHMVNRVESNGYGREEAVQVTSQLYGQHANAGLGEPVHTWPLTV